MREVCCSLWHKSDQLWSVAANQSLVEAQGDRVGVESQLGRGSVFFAVLPLGSDPARAHALQVAKPPSGSGSTVTSATDARDSILNVPTPRSPHPGPRVLVVDDDFASLRLMGAALRQLGYDPIGAEDGEPGPRSPTS